MYGDIIRQLRKQKGVTQKELGAYLGYTEAHISNIENNNRAVSSNDLLKISHFLKTNVSFFDNAPVAHVNFRSRDPKNYTDDLDPIIVDDFKKYAKKILENPV